MLPVEEKISPNQIQAIARTLKSRLYRLSLALGSGEAITLEALMSQADPTYEEIDANFLFIGGEGAFQTLIKKFPQYFPIFRHLASFDPERLKPLMSMWLRLHKLFVRNLYLMKLSGFHNRLSIFETKLNPIYYPQSSIDAIFEEAAEILQSEVIPVEQEIEMAFDQVWENSPNSPFVIDVSAQDIRQGLRLARTQDQLIFLRLNNLPTENAALIESFSHLSHFLLADSARRRITLELNAHQFSEFINFYAALDNTSPALRTFNIVGTGYTPAHLLMVSALRKSIPVLFQEKDGQLIFQSQQIADLDQNFARARMFDEKVAIDESNLNPLQQLRRMRLAKNKQLTLSGLEMVVQIEEEAEVAQEQEVAEEQQELNQEIFEGASTESVSPRGLLGYAELTMEPFASLLLAAYQHFFPYQEPANVEKILEMIGLDALVRFQQGIHLLTVPAFLKILSKLPQYCNGVSFHNIPSEFYFQRTGTLNVLAWDPAHEREGNVFTQSRENDDALYDLRHLQFVLQQCELAHFQNSLLVLLTDKISADLAWQILTDQVKSDLSQIQGFDLAKAQEIFNDIFGSVSDIKLNEASRRSLFQEFAKIYLLFGGKSLLGLLHALQKILRSHQQLYSILLDKYFINNPDSTAYGTEENRIAIETLCQFSSDQAKWWVMLHDHQQKIVSRLVPGLRAFNAFWARISKHRHYFIDTGWISAIRHALCNLSVIHVPTILDRLLLVYECAQNQQEQLKFLPTAIRECFLPYGACYAITCDGYRLVTQEMMQDKYSFYDRDMMTLPADLKYFAKKTASPFAVEFSKTNFYEIESELEQQRSWAMLPHRLPVTTYRAVQLALQSQVKELAEEKEADDKKCEVTQEVFFPAASGLLQSPEVAQEVSTFIQEFSSIQKCKIYFGKGENDFRAEAGAILAISCNAQLDVVKSFTSNSYHNIRHFLDILAQSYEWRRRFPGGNWRLEITGAPGARTIQVRWSTQNNREESMLVYSALLPDEIQHCTINELSLLQPLAEFFSHKFTALRNFPDQNLYVALQLRHIYGNIWSVACYLSNRIQFLDKTTHDLRVTSVNLEAKYKIDDAEAPCARLTSLKLFDGGRGPYDHIMFLDESPKEKIQLMHLVQRATTHERGGILSEDEALSISSFMQQLLNEIPDRNRQAYLVDMLLEMLGNSYLPNYAMKIANEKGIAKNKLRCMQPYYPYLGPSFVPRVMVSEQFVKLNLPEVKTILQILVEFEQELYESKVPNPNIALDQMALYLKYQLAAYGVRYLQLLQRWDSHSNGLAIHDFLSLLDAIRLQFSSPDTPIYESEFDYYDKEAPDTKHAFHYYSLPQWQVEAPLNQLTCELVHALAIVRYDENNLTYFPKLAELAGKFVRAGRVKTLEFAISILKKINIAQSLAQTCLLPTCQDMVEFFDALLLDPALDIESYLIRQFPLIVYAENSTNVAVPSGSLSQELRLQVAGLKDFFKQPTLKFFIPDEQKEAAKALFLEMPEVKGSVVTTGLINLADGAKNKAFSWLDEWLVQANLSLMHEDNFDEKFDKDPLGYAKYFVLKTKSSAPIGAKLTFFMLEQILLRGFRSQIESKRTGLIAELAPADPDAESAERIQYWTQFIDAWLPMPPADILECLDTAVLDNIDLYLTKITMLALLLKTIPLTLQTAVLCTLVKFAKVPSNDAQERIEYFARLEIVLKVILHYTGGDSSIWPELLCKTLLQHQLFSKIDRAHLHDMLSKLAAERLLGTHIDCQRIIATILAIYTEVAEVNEFILLLLSQRRTNYPGFSYLVAAASKFEDESVEVKHQFIELATRIALISQPHPHRIRNLIWKALADPALFAVEFVSLLSMQSPEIQKILIVTLAHKTEPADFNKIQQVTAYLPMLQLNNPALFERLSQTYEIDRCIPDFAALHELATKPGSSVTETIRRHMRPPANLLNQFQQENIERLINHLEIFNGNSWQLLDWPSRERLLQDFLYVQSVGFDCPVMYAATDDDINSQNLKPLSVRELDGIQMRSYTKTLKTTYEAATLQGENPVARQQALLFLACEREAHFRASSQDIFANELQCLSILLQIDRPESAIQQIDTGQGKTCIKNLFSALAWFMGAAAMACTTTDELTVRDLSGARDFCYYLNIRVMDSPVSARRSNIEDFAEHAIAHANFSQAGLYRLRAKYEKAVLPEHEWWIFDEVDDRLLDSPTLLRIARAIISKSARNEFFWIYPLFNQFIDTELDEFEDELQDIQRCLKFFRKTLRHQPNRLKQFEALISRLGIEPIDTWIDASLSSQYLQAETKAGRIRYLVEAEEEGEEHAAIVHQARVLIGGHINREVQWSNGVHPMVHARENAINEARGIPGNFPYKPERQVVASYTPKTLVNSLLRKKRGTGRFLGITGTIGDDLECKEWVDKYGVYLYRLPSQQISRRVTLPTIYVDDTQKLYKALLKEVIQHIKQIPSGDKNPLPLHILCDEDELKEANDLADYLEQHLFTNPSYAKLMKRCHWQRYTADKYVYDGKAEVVLTDAQRKSHPFKAGVVNHDVEQRAGLPGCITVSNILARGNDILPIQKNSVAFTINLFGRKLRQGSGRVSRFDLPGTTRSFISKLDYDPSIAQQQRFDREVCGDMIDALSELAPQFTNEQDEYQFSRYITNLSRHWNYILREAKQSQDVEEQSEPSRAENIQKLESWVFENWPFADDLLPDNFFEQYLQSCLPLPIQIPEKEVVFVPVNLKRANRYKIYLQRLPDSIKSLTGQAREEALGPVYRNYLIRELELVLQTMPRNLATTYSAQLTKLEPEAFIYNIFCSILIRAYPNKPHAQTMPYHRIANKLMALAHELKQPDLLAKMATALRNQQSTLTPECFESIHQIQLALNYCGVSDPIDVLVEVPNRQLNTILGNYRHNHFWKLSKDRINLADNLQKDLDAAATPALALSVLDAAELEMYANDFASDKNAYFARHFYNNRLRNTLAQMRYCFLSQPMVNGPHVDELSASLNQLINFFVQHLSTKLILRQQIFKLLEKSQLIDLETIDQFAQLLQDNHTAYTKLHSSRSEQMLYETLQQRLQDQTATLLAVGDQKEGAAPILKWQPSVELIQAMKKPVDSPHQSTSYACTLFLAVTKLHIPPILAVCALLIFQPELLVTLVVAMLSVVLGAYWGLSESNAYHRTNTALLPG